MLPKLNILKYGMPLTKRSLLLNLIFSSIFYASYFVFFVYIPQYFVSLANNLLLLQASLNIVIVITLLATSFLINRMKELQVMYVCSVGISVSAATLLFASSYILTLFLLFIIAIFFSVGQLAFLKHFWKSTMQEERGRAAGLMGFTSLFLNLVVYIAVAEAIDFSRIAALGMIFNFAILGTLLLRPWKFALKNRGGNGNYIEKRTIFLYVIPWLLFSLINATLAKSISVHISQQISFSFYLFLTVLQIVAAFFGALMGGVISDFFGRRTPLVFSLTLYGISSALAGIANNFAVFYFVYIANGFSWGILLAIYTFVIWGDLSNRENCAKMYAIGFIIIYLTQAVGLIPLEQISQIPLVASSLGGCLLIFLSNIPIFLAPELLPSDFRERIRLKLHMNAIRKVKKTQS
jgi:predicted MFS family arabinose efflux permease